MGICVCVSVWVSATWIQVPWMHVEHQSQVNPLAWVLGPRLSPLNSSKHSEPEHSLQPRICLLSGTHHILSGKAFPLVMYLKALDFGRFWIFTQPLSDCSGKHLGNILMSIKIYTPEHKRQKRDEGDWKVQETAIKVLGSCATKLKSKTPQGHKESAMVTNRCKPIAGSPENFTGKITSQPPPKIILKEVFTSSQTITSPYGSQASYS